MIEVKKTKAKPTVKELLLTEQLVRGKVLLDKKVASQKAMEEAIEFEMRNRRQKVKGEWLRSSMDAWGFRK